MKECVLEQNGARKWTQPHGQKPFIHGYPSYYTLDIYLLISTNLENLARRATPNS